MEVYLIRHGIAAERGTYANDDERPLIDKGRTKTKKVAQSLKEVGVSFDAILTSPLVRAKQTADILFEAGLSSQVEFFSALSPGGNIQDFVTWQCQKKYRNKSVALVGHQPDLGMWAEILVWGTAQGKIIVKKAGLIGIKFTSIDNNLIGNGELFLLSSPKFLTKNK